MAEVDWGQAESQLKSKAGQWYDPSMLEDLKRNTSYNAGTGVSDVDNWIDRIANKAQLRGSNEANSTYQANNTGGQTVGPTGNLNAPAQSVRAAGTSFGMSNEAYNAAHPNAGGTPQPSNGWGQWAGGATGNMQAGAWSNPATSARADDLYRLLSQRAQQGLGINPHDPIIASQVGAFRADQTRQARNTIDEMAERGGPTANVEGIRRSQLEGANRAAGSLQGQLMQNELGARRQEIAGALQQMGGMLSDQQRVDLQQQLAMMDYALRQQGMLSENDRWAAEFGRNVTNDANYWNDRRISG